MPISIKFAEREGGFFMEVNAGYKTFWLRLPHERHMFRLGFSNGLVLSLFTRGADHISARVEHGGRGGVRINSFTNNKVSAVTEICIADDDNIRWMLMSTDQLLKMR